MFLLVSLSYLKSAESFQVHWDTEVWFHYLNCIFLLKIFLHYQCNNFGKKKTKKTGLVFIVFQFYICNWFIWLDCVDFQWVNHYLLGKSKIKDQIQQKASLDFCIYTLNEEESLLGASDGYLIAVMPPLFNTNGNMNLYEYLNISWI